MGFGVAVPVGDNSHPISAFSIKLLKSRSSSARTRQRSSGDRSHLLARLRANKAELLMVLDHPEIPRHTNGSENDIRCQVTKRQVSGDTKTDTGRHCHDALLGLAETCRKRCISFWDYLGARLGVPNVPIAPQLAEPDSLPRPTRLTRRSPGVMPRLPLQVTGAKPRARRRSIGPVAERLPQKSAIS